MKTAIKYPYYFALLAFVGFSANAQKLPTVQQASLNAPANIKIDGKTAEWDNKFQAYNKSTSVFYTMANDADKLYLVVQATDKTIIDKVLSNKITLTVFNAKDKNMAPVTITTPAIKGNKAYFNDFMNKPATDSIINQTSKEIAASLKELTATGISDITDPTISVYNDYGIKFAGRVDNNKAYTMELAVPLKYFSQQSNSTNLDYKIQLNGFMSSGTVRVRVNGGGDGSSLMKADGGGGAAPASVNALLGQMASVGGSMSELMNDTNFSGTYTLVKR